ncbi:MAG: glutamyl-tRNA amidotransferase [Leptolyngbyaceae bacterium]|nr:glutamyl-tRNA amidotransferase [Leptolyngbyaceae bacterium]
MAIAPPDDWNLRFSSQLRPENALQLTESADRNLRMDTINLAVNGTLMRGLELNPNMINAGATFVREAMTEPAYRLWSIGDRHPAMLRVKSGGTSVALEVWAVPPAGLAQILLQEPPGLCIGKVKLSDGEDVLGVVGEPIICEGQLEITQWGGWRAYRASAT